MATQSVQKDFQGPDWPLGFIKVVTPGTPVSIMSLVDPNNFAAPQTAAPTPTAANQVPEYTVRFQQIIFQAFIPNTDGMQPSAGNVYLVRKGVQGAGNRDDYGSMVYVFQPGDSLYLASAPLNRDVFSPYRYYVDADNSGDGLLVVGIVQ